jgi:hypothetical protein
MVIGKRQKRISENSSGKEAVSPLPCEGCDTLECHTCAENDRQWTAKEQEHYRDVFSLLQHLAFNPKFHGDSRVLVFYQDQVPEGYRKLTMDERILMTEILSHSPVYVEIWMQKLKDHRVESGEL